MNFGTVLKQCNIKSPDNIKFPDVSHICCDSRFAGANSVFVCIKGALDDGHLYAVSAYKNGCRAFIAEKELDLPEGAAIAYVADSRLALSALSAEIYSHPSKKIKVIGITGTKGKTTTALMISGILNKLGYPAGYIGSNGVTYGNVSIATSNTTPQSCDIHRYLNDMLLADMKYAVLEVSSQAIYHERVAHIDFDTCIFTNLSPDHIGGNEHPTFEHYKFSKSRLFSEFSHSLTLVNTDDTAYRDMIIADKAKIESFGICSDAKHTASNISLRHTRSAIGMSFDYINDGISYPVNINFPGEFNVMNALAAISVCSHIHSSIRDIADAISSVTVKGRFEPVFVLPYASVIIDYAHNGTSLTSVLKTLRSYCNNGRIICLFGSVGGRTKMRRAELAEAAGLLSDYCILTSDNPDNEPPEQIIRDIANAFPEGSCPYISIPDRREAIIAGVEMLRSGDILLLAGKGHEDYQLVHGKRQPFCEREIVLEAAREMAKV